MLLVAAVVVVASAIAAMDGSGAGGALSSGTIAFSASGRVYVIRPDGTHKRLLIDSVAGAPAWSWDGRQIAYIAESGLVAVARADGTGRRELSIGPAFCDQPAWSPSGREIACTARWIEESRTGREWYSAVYVGNVRSGRDRQLAAGRSAPAWSPDGTRIAFDGIAVLDLATRRIRNLGPGSTPDWSPAGTKIAYSTDHTIAVMNADGSDRRTIVRSQKLVAAPSWAPDGSRIVYTSIASGGRFTLFIVGADGSGRRVLSRDGADGDWGPR